MKRSVERILTSHAGSLPRPDDLVDLSRAIAAGASNDHASLAAKLRAAVGDVVRKQAEVGVDIANDGEFGKAMRQARDFGAWTTYAYQRLSGWEVDEGRSLPCAGSDLQRFATRRDMTKFADFYRENQLLGAPGSQRMPPTLATGRLFTGPISYVGHAASTADIENFKAALDETQLEEPFMTAVAPGSFGRGLNYYYKSDEEFLFALADALREEYTAIVGAGFILQLDDPGLPDSWDTVDPAPTLEEYRKYATICVEALNHGLRGLPEEQIRYHICWGSWAGPHTTDIPLRDVADLMLKVNAGAYSVEAGNVRHRHEWKVWKDVRLPDGKVLMPGIVTHKTNVVEHPEAVADHIVEYAGVVGRENIIAGTDCGLGGRIHPQIAWAKLEALVEGARLASEQLWK